MYRSWKQTWESILPKKGSKEDSKVYLPENDKEVEDGVKKANAERLKRALDYAVSLKFYLRGYGNSNYPDFLRTYEFGIIPKDEYNKRKKENPSSIHLVTYCNVLSRKIARGCFDYGLYDNRSDPEYTWMKWKLTAAFPYDYSKIFYMMLPRDAKALAETSARNGMIIERTCEEAQERANSGIYIWGVWEGTNKEVGHELVVYPNNNEKEFDPVKGCKIAQAGWDNISDIYISDPRCFGKNWRNLGIKFFEFPYEQLGFVDCLPLAEV